DVERDEERDMADEVADHEREHDERADEPQPRPHGPHVPARSARRRSFEPRRGVGGSGDTGHDVVENPNLGRMTTLEDQYSRGEIPRERGFRTPSSPSLPGSARQSVAMLPQTKKWHGGAGQAHA